MSANNAMDAGELRQSSLPWGRSASFGASQDRNGDVRALAGSDVPSAWAAVL